MEYGYYKGVKVCFNDGSLYKRQSKHSENWVPKSSCPNNKGYLTSNIEGKTQYVSRIVMSAYLGRELTPDETVDHRNHIVTDNSIANLRILTRAQNLQWRRNQINNTSGHTGVIWNKKHQKWYANIKIDRKPVHLGSFEKIEDAVTARQNMVREMNNILDENGERKYHYYDKF